MNFKYERDLGDEVKKRLNVALKAKTWVIQFEVSIEGGKAANNALLVQKAYDKLNRYLETKAVAWMGDRFDDKSNQGKSPEAIVKASLDAFIRAHKASIDKLLAEVWSDAKELDSVMSKHGDRIKLALKVVAFSASVAVAVVTAPTGVGLALGIYSMVQSGISILSDIKKGRMDTASVARDLEEMHKALRKNVIHLGNQINEAKADKVDKAQLTAEMTAKTLINSVAGKELFTTVKGMRDQVDLLRKKLKRDEAANVKLGAMVNDFLDQQFDLQAAGEKDIAAIKATLDKMKKDGVADSHPYFKTLVQKLKDYQAAVDRSAADVHALLEKISTDAKAIDDYEALAEKMDKFMDRYEQLMHGKVVAAAAFVLELAKLTAGLTATAASGLGKLVDEFPRRSADLQSNLTRLVNSAALTKDVALACKDATDEFNKISQSLSRARR